MRKIVLLSMITLDGVMQAPGGPEEDRSGGFEYGGWVAPYSDETYNKVVEQELRPTDYLLGRKTFEIWVDYWPQHDQFWPGINSGNKYVFSNTLSNEHPKVKGWQHSFVLNNVEDIKQIKNSDGPDIQVWGSSELVQLLLKNELVDEIKLKIHPLMLGKGKKLFGNEVMPAAFRLTNSIVTTTGVIIVDLHRDGEVKTGDLTV